MQDFKSSTSRLARLFKKSRELWKQRAQEKQAMIRGLEVKVRDVSHSRDRWKQKAKRLEQELRQRREEDASSEDDPIEPTLVSTVEPNAFVPPPDHAYPTFVMQLSLQLATQALTSLRGVAKSLELFGQYVELPSPSMDSIRKWLYRIGFAAFCYEQVEAPLVLLAERLAH